MEKYVPDIYKKSIYTINYEKLKARGIKCLLFDLDNTLVPVNVDVPTKKIKELFNYLEKDFKVIIISNSSRKRLTPFKEGLNVDTAPLALKPRKDKYEKIIKEYNLKPMEIAAIGDQLCTDILGANRMGIRSILINPISNVDFFATVFNRFLEKIIMKQLEKKELFKKGEYFE